MDKHWELIEEVYRKGWESKGQTDYDPRGTAEWQAAVDAFDVIKHRLAEAEARIDELETKEALYDEHSDAVKKCLALNKQLAATEKALRWACNVYIVDDYYTGDLRKERLERSVRYAMKEANGSEGK